jgi:dipeptidyl aminopeptidase/acylaminoacyl peptidase
VPRVLLSAAILLISVAAFAQQSLITPQALTDPAKLESKNLSEMQNFSVEKLFTIRDVGGSTWSPDGQQVAFISNISGHDNLWIVPAAGGWPTQLTISDQRQAHPVWSPDGTWIAFLSDHDGDRRWKLYLVSPKRGDVLNLTTAPDTAEEDPAWAPNGREIAYISKPKTGSSYEIELMDVATRHVRHLTQNTPKELSNTHPVFSRDGKFLIYTQARAGSRDSNVFLLDLASGKSANLTPHEGQNNYAASDISPDGKTILLTSDAANGYDNVALFDIPTRKLDWLTHEKTQVNARTFSPDGQSLTWTENVGGNSEIYVYDIATKRAVALPLQAGVNSLRDNPLPYTRDGSKLLYCHTSAAAPADLWTYDSPSRQSQQITHSLVAGVRRSDMVEPYLVHYPSRDGKWTISALAYIPNDIQRNGKFPAIVYVHDGPASQFVNSFDPFLQYIINQGYIVIAPNYRGSIGYGEQFRDANRANLGGADVDDLLDAAEWIKKSGFVDPKKMIVMGDGYGGYLSLMAAAKEPDLWAAGVSIDPFVNWLTRIAHEDPLARESDLADMGDPVKNKGLYEEHSPANLNDRVNTPLLLLASDDPRCPKSELQAMADALKKKSGIAQLKTYDNVGLSSLANRIDAFQRVSDFLKVRVPSPGCGCSIYE